MAVRKDLEIRQGSTYSKVVRWETEPLIFVPISAISRSAPARVTTQSPHGLPEGWRAAIVSADGMKEINAEESPPSTSDYHRATVVSATAVDFPDINSSSYRAYTSGGYLQFYTPLDLAGFTARMSIKTKVGGTLLLSLTTANGGIAIDNTSKQISLSVSATDTATLTWKKGVYDLELVSPGGVVTALLYGSVSVIPEITT